LCRQGDNFGEAAIVSFSGSRRESAQAKTAVELFVLAKEDIDYILIQHPEARNEGIFKDLMKLRLNGGDWTASNASANVNFNIIPTLEDHDNKAPRESALNYFIKKRRESSTIVLEPNGQRLRRSNSVITNVCPPEMTQVLSLQEKQKATSRLDTAADLGKAARKSQCFADKPTEDPVEALQKTLGSPSDELERILGQRNDKNGNRPSKVAPTPDVKHDMYMRKKRRSSLPDALITNIRRLSVS
jgi:hypothetical protein